MLPFPITIAGSLLDSLDDLVEMLNTRGRDNITDNPAQLAPYEGLIDDARDPQKAEALAHAAAELIGRSDDPGVLQLCAHIGAHGHEIYYQALVDRLLFGNPIPDVAGMSEPTLADELANTLATREFGNYPHLHGLAVSCLQGQGLLRSTLYVCSASDPNHEGAALLIDVLDKHSIDDRMMTVVGLLVYRLAKDGSDRLLDIAPALRRHPHVLRALCGQRAEQGNASWWAEHKDQFKADANYRDAADLRTALAPLLTTAALPNTVEMLGSIAYELGLPSETNEDRPWLPARRDPEEPGLQTLFDQVTDPVAPLLEHPHELVRHQALSVLAVAPGEATTTALLKACGSRDPDLRGQALAVLADHQPRTAVPLLREAITDPNPLVRLYAWSGLPGNSRWNELAQQAFAESDPVVACSALQMVGELGAYNAVEELLDVVVNDDESALRLQGAMAGLNAFSSNVVARITDRLVDASPPATWRLLQVLDTHGALQPAQVLPLIADSIPIATRTEAAAWLTARELAAFKRGPAHAALTKLSEEGSSIDRLFAATKLLEIGDNDALLLILPLWFGPDAVRQPVRAALCGADTYADRHLGIYVKHAVSKPELGAAVIDLIRVRGITGLTDHVHKAATAGGSDDLTRAALVALFAEEPDQAAGLLAAELNRRAGLEQATWAAGFLQLEGPLPASFTDVLLARPEAILVGFGLDLIVRLPRPEVLATLRQALNSEMGRLDGRAPVRPDLGMASIGSNDQFLAQVQASTADLRTQLSGQSEILAGFDNLELQTWIDPSAVVIATIVSHAMKAGLVELAATIDELLARSYASHVRARAIYGLAALAPWRLTDRNLAPDPDGLLDRIRSLTRLGHNPES